MDSLIVFDPLGVRRVFNFQNLVSCPGEVKLLNFLARWDEGLLGFLDFQELGLIFKVPLDKILIEVFLEVLGLWLFVFKIDFE